MTQSSRAANPDGPWLLARTCLGYLQPAGSVVLTSRGTAPAAGTRRVETDALEMHFAQNAHIRPGESRKREHAGSGESGMAKRLHGCRKAHSANDANEREANEFEIRRSRITCSNSQGSGGVEVARQLGDGPEQTTSSRELTAKFDGTGQWSTIDQAGDVRFRDGLRGGQGDRAHLDRADEYGHAQRVGDPHRCDDAHHGAVGGVHAKFESTARRRKRADHRIARRDRERLELCRRSPRTSPRITWLPTRREGTPSIPVMRRLWQGQSVIEADTIELDNPSHILDRSRAGARSISPGGVESQAERRRRSRRPHQNQANVRSDRHASAGTGACAWRFADVLGELSHAPGLNRTPTPTPCKVRSRPIRLTCSFQRRVP